MRTPGQLYFKCWCRSNFGWPLQVGIVCQQNGRVYQQRAYRNIQSRRQAQHTTHTHASIGKHIPDKENDRLSGTTQPSARQIDAGVQQWLPVYCTEHAFLGDCKLTLCRSPQPSSWNRVRRASENHLSVTRKHMFGTERFVNS